MIAPEVQGKGIQPGMEGAVLEEDFRAQCQ